jgi:hypothetical protein
MQLMMEYTFNNNKSIEKIKEGKYKNIRLFYGFVSSYRITFLLPPPPHHHLPASHIHMHVMIQSHELRLHHESIGHLGHQRRSSRRSGAAA